MYHVSSMILKVTFVLNKFVYSCSKARRGHARMVAGFATTHATSAFHHSRCEFESRLWRGVPDTTLCVKFVSDLRQVGCFLRVLQFPPTMKLTATIYLKYC